MTQARMGTTQRKLFTMGWAVPLLVLAGCAAEVAETNLGASGEAVRKADAESLFTSSSIGEVATLEFTEGSGAPYEGRALASDEIYDRGCLPGTDASLTLGWGGGELVQGVIQRENYATLAGGGSVSGTVEVCDDETLPTIRWWVEIRRNDKHLQFTLIPPDGAPVVLEDATRKCIGDNCSIFAYDLPVDRPGAWTVLVENTGRASTDLAQVSVYGRGR